MEPVVVENPQKRQLELRIGDELVGRVEYRPAGDAIIVAHTEIDEGHQGRGLGSRLVREMLDRIRARGKTVIPTCQFTAGYIRRHPELIDLVDPSLRSQFSPRARG